MVESKGEMRLCPFRVTTRISLKHSGESVTNQYFMPCIKEMCNCYERFEYDGEISESCYRDNIGYIRRHIKQEGGQA